MPTNNREETDPKQTEGAAALEPDVALRDALEDVVADVVGGLEAVLVVHVLQHELVQGPSLFSLPFSAQIKKNFLFVRHNKLIEAAMFFKIIEVKYALHKV